MAYATTSTRSPIWIRGAGYDIALVMGGALSTLSIAGAVVLNPSLLPVFFWLWLIGFEGSHFWATYSRTYIDTAFRRQNAVILRRSLIFFALPVMAVMADKLFSTAMVTTSYGFFIFLWSLYHNVRQHYGFVSIYVKKSGMEAGLSERYRTLIYWSVSDAQLYFAFNFKTQATFSAAPKPADLPLITAMILQYGPFIISLLSGIYLLFLTAKTYHTHGKVALIPAAYVGICLIFYSTMFYVIAPREPFFSHHANGAQLFMLIAIMNSLFHNIQYHALVWHYANKRYGEEPESEGIYGLAQRVNGSPATYMLTALALGAGFAYIVWNMGDWPSWTGEFTLTPFNSVAYILYFGIVGHHFYLDQFIWKLSKQPELRKYLDAYTPAEPLLSAL